MKVTFTTILVLGFAISSMAQSTPPIPNGGFENWGGNSIPPSNSSAQPNEPNGYYSNQSGSSVAQIGPQTCFKDNSVKHSGSSAVRVQSELVPIVNVVVNGNVTTGCINAPSTSKAEGYIGTWNDDDHSEARRQAFDGRPDSLVGWYQYTQGGASEKGKVRAILHKGHYFDPETPVNSNHPDSSINKIGDAVFVTNATNTTTWTRFSVPFAYVNSTTPQYIMVNITSSNDQLTNTAGSKMWVDDLAVIYNGSQGITQANAEKAISVNAYNHKIYIDFLNRTHGESSLEVYNAAGQLVATQALDNNGLNEVDMSGKAMGVYSYIITGKDFFRTGKLYVE